MQRQGMLLEKPPSIFDADFPMTPTDAVYKETRVDRGGALIKVEARGDEIVEEMKRALGVIRTNIVGKKIGYDNATITVSSMDQNLMFAITVSVENGGMKVIINGNVGGEFKETRASSEQRYDDDWISSETADLFTDSGGKADNMVKIEYMKL